MNHSAYHEAEARLLGSRCRVERHEYSWSFAFQNLCTISVSCPWRLIQSGAVMLSDGDDGQQYGLPQPVDCEVRANLLLGDAQLAKLQLIEASSDLVAVFDNDLRLETFTNSIGYEGWQANFCGQEGISLIVGMGGGGLSIF